MTFRTHRLIPDNFAAVGLCTLASERRRPCLWTNARASPLVRHLGAIRSRLIS